MRPEEVVRLKDLWLKYCPLRVEVCDHYLFSSSPGRCKDCKDCRECDEYDEYRSLMGQALGEL